MYMLRAYQSPSPMAEVGPQCAQIPNFASRNHSGHCADSNDPSAEYGPEAMGISLAGTSVPRTILAAANTAAALKKVLREAVMIPPIIGYLSRTQTEIIGLQLEMRQCEMALVLTAFRRTSQSQPAPEPAP